MKPGIILATAALFASQAVFAQSDYELTDIDENEKTATISKYTGSTEITELVVPKVIGEYTITKIYKLQATTQTSVKRVYLPPQISITGKLMEDQVNLKCGVIDTLKSITPTTAFPFFYSSVTNALESIYVFSESKYENEALCGTNAASNLGYLGFVSIIYSDNKSEAVQTYGGKGTDGSSSKAADFNQAKYENLLWALTQHLKNIDLKSMADIKTIDLSTLNQKVSTKSVTFSIENFNPNNQLSGSTTIILDNNTAYTTITDLVNFSAPSSDITSTIHYSRGNTKDWNSVCLPFALSETDLPETSKIYTISGGDGSTLNLTRKGSVEAGEPCFIYSTAESWDLTLKDRSLSKDIKAGSSEEIDNWTIIGSFTTQTIGAGKYKLADNGQSLGITNGTDAKVYPFRCYLEYSGRNSAPARVDVSIDEEQTITLIPDDGEPQQVRLYDLMGHPVQHSDQPRLVKGKNIIIR